MQQEQTNQMTYSYKFRKIEEGAPIATLARRASIGFIIKLMRSKKIIKYFDNRKWLYAHDDFLRAFFIIDRCFQNNLLDYFQDDYLRFYKQIERQKYGYRHFGCDQFKLSLEINILRDINKSDEIKKEILKNYLSIFNCNSFLESDIPF